MKMRVLVAVGLRMLGRCSKATRWRDWGLVSQLEEGDARWWRWRWRAYVVMEDSRITASETHGTFLPSDFVGIMYARLMMEVGVGKWRKGPWQRQLAGRSPAAACMIRACAYRLCISSSYRY